MDHSQILDRKGSSAKAHVADRELGRPAYVALLAVYLGFAGFAAYEVARELLVSLN